MKKLTQKKTILMWLKEYESITARQALNCLLPEPSTRIFSLNNGDEINEYSKPEKI
jgi:hypothetical protein